MKQVVKNPEHVEEFEATLKLVHAQYEVWWNQNTDWSAHYGNAGRILLSTGYCEGAMRVHGWHYVNGAWDKVDARTN